MSSWANIRVPRKRDISQIPEELRPLLVTRAQHPGVIMSESFQTSSSDDYNFNDYYSNMVIDPSLPKPKKEERYAPKEYVSKKIETRPSPGAIELLYNGKSYVFVILRHLRNAKDNELWISSYNSIRKYYTNKIIIIDDNSSVNTVHGNLYETETIQSEFNGAGEIIPYYYFLQHKWAYTMIFLHDSMFLHRRFEEEELEHSVRFHWYFNSNRADDKRKISTYLSLLKNDKSKEVLDFYQNATSIWKGCSGGASMIDYSVVFQLEDTYNLFTTLIMAIKSRKDREAFERVLGIVLYYEELIQDKTCSNFGDIMRYPGCFESEHTSPDTAATIVNQYAYKTAILKVWRGR